MMEKKNMSQEIRTVKCPVCGEMFQTNRYKKYCGEKCRLKLKKISDAAKRAEKSKKLKEKKYVHKTTAVEDIAVLARAEGLSYGQYVARHRCKPCGL